MRRRNRASRGTHEEAQPRKTRDVSKRSIESSLNFSTKRAISRNGYEFFNERRASIFALTKVSKSEQSGGHGDVGTLGRRYGHQYSSMYCSVHSQGLDPYATSPCPHVHPYTKESPGNVWGSGEVLVTTRAARFRDVGTWRSENGYEGATNRSAFSRG
jgi:hypothetical protein